MPAHKAKAAAGRQHFYVEPSRFVTAAIVFSLFYLMPAAIFKPEWVPSSLGKKLGKLDSVDAEFARKTRIL